MLPGNIVYMIVVYSVFGLGGDILTSLIAVFPNQLNGLFNATLYNHYGINADSTLLSFGISFMSLITFVSLVLGIFLLIPLMDSKGRRFCSVYLRFYMTVIPALMMEVGIIWESAEIFLLGFFITGLSMPVRAVVLNIHVAECSPDKYRGFVTASMSMGGVISSLVMFYIARPSVFGGDKWFIIPIISIILSACLFISTLRLPDSPKYLISKSEKSRVVKAIKFYHGADADIEDVIDSIEKEKNLTVKEKLSIKDIWRSETLREALIIMLSFELFTLTSPVTVEKNYTVILHTSMGLTVDQSMTLNFLLTLIFGPFKLIGSYVIEKYGRRFVLFLSAAIIYSKVVLMFAAQFIAYFYGPSNITVIMAVSNEVLTEICGLTGLGAIGTLLITELFPPSARVSMSQLDMMFICFSSTSIIASYPIIANLFAPGFYIPGIFLQPLLIFFLYKKFPETKNRAVYDIVRTLDEDVKSRGGSIISFDFALGRGSASVMRKRSNTYYYHQTETTPLLFDDSLNRPRANSEANRRVHWNPPKYTQIL